MWGTFLTCRNTSEIGTLKTCPTVTRTWLLDGKIITSRLLRLAPVLTGFALVLLAGLVHGLWTQRWHRSAELETAAARLTHLPQAVGDWKGEPVELDAQDLAASGAAGYWMERFTHRRTGAVVTLVLLCGRPGPLSVHRPEYCYRGAGF